MGDGYTQNGTYNREYPRQARQVKGSRAAVLPLLYCIHITNASRKALILLCSMALYELFCR